MTRFWIAFFLILASAGAALSYILRGPSLEDRSGFDISQAMWPPSTSEMVKLADANGADPDTPAGRTARQRYTVLFKKRYRGHEPNLAVGIRFKTNTLLDVLISPRMEPWNIDRIAVSTWEETRQVFGHPFNIDLYVTYIGASPIKIGYVRPDKDAPGKVDVVHLSQTEMPILRAGNARRSLSFSH